MTDMKFAADHTESVMRHYRDRAYRTINASPEVLLDGPGGHTGVHAQATFARLFGFDDQVDADWRIDREVPSLLMAIPVGVSAAFEDIGTVYPSIRTARYDLWSGHVALQLDATLAAPLGIEFDMTTLQATLLFLRYKRVV